MKTRTTLLCLPLALLLTFSSSCSSEVVEAATEPRAAASATSPEHTIAQHAPKAQDPQDATANGKRPLADAPLEQQRLDLLHVAWHAASAFPITPHVQSRSRAQEKVVLMCLELDQPLLARKWLNGIADWRRGACLADYAHYCMLHGDAAEAEKSLKMAGDVAANLRTEANPQEWQRDTILLKMARTWARLGNREEAERCSSVVDPTSGLAFDSGLAATAAGRADLITEANFDRELAQMDDLLVNEASGLTFAALVTCARLFDKFYDDHARRDKIEQRVRLVNAKLPPNYKLTTFLELARISIEHGDLDKATESLRLAREFLEQTEWTTDVRIAFVAQLAGLTGRAGKVDEARRMLDEGLAVFQDERDTFRQTKRAEILRPFAEAFHAIGDRERANDVYGMVVEEGVENPNSRPRAEDVADTCLSMAKHAFAPDRELFARIREIVDGLGDPW